MGFKILPIEEDEVDSIEPKYDIFEITCPKKWLHEMLRHSQVATKDNIPPPLFSDQDIWDKDDREIAHCPYINSVVSSSSINDFLDTCSYERLVHHDDCVPEDHGYPSLPAEDYEFKVLLHPSHRQAAVSFAVRP